ncbi:MAG: hypothetical protein EXQ70_03815 [Solirubrobacterales bacterium]|nr:hypothetical protein [Solirubrobacterales bacterium]
MPVKLHRCGVMWVKIDAHPCWAVQKALDEKGIDYEIVKEATFPRSKRTEVTEKTGQSLLPVLELDDGRWIREDGKTLAAKIRSGELP